MKRVVIIGSGNLAQVLGTVITESPYKLVQIYARNRAKGQSIAQSLDCGFGSQPSELAQADIYLIAVSDSAIAEVSEGLNFGEAVVAHTAGSVPMEKLSEKITQRGIVYPFQTFTTGRKFHFRDTPIFVTGETPAAEQVLLELSRSISDDVRQTKGEELRYIHLAGVFACNFSNFMFSMAQNILAERGLSPQIVKPLIEEVVAKAIDAPLAKQVQTGPAIRGDIETQNKHLRMLSGHPKMQNLYQILSSEIWETSKKI